MTQTQEITLAPAAGSGIGKLVFDALLARPDFIPSMVAAAMGGLQATTSFYNPATREVIEKIDFKTRMQAWLSLTAHAEGEPVKRIIHQHLGAGGKLDFKAALQESPELAQALSRELDKANWKTSGHQAHKRPVKKVAGVASSQPTKDAEIDPPAGPAGAF